MVAAATEEALGAFEGSSCVVTGGLGFIGSNLALALHAGGARVTVVDSLVPRHGGNPRNVEDAPLELVHADIADGPAVAPALAGADFVFNLAGQVSHIDSMEDPLADLDCNARSQLGFLELLREHAPSARVVYASTRQVYGRPQYLPVDEGHPIEPVDVNGVSKYAAERLHSVYELAHGLRATTLRLTNVYGPRQRLRGTHQGVIPVFVRNALEGREITIFGDGSHTRDCLHVDDAVRAFAIAAVSEAAVGEVFNVGHHEQLTLGQMAEYAVAASGAGRIVRAPLPAELARIDIGSYSTDWSKIRDRLGWRPGIAFAEGIADTISYYRSRPGWYV